MRSVEEPTLPALLAMLGDCCYYAKGTKENNKEAYRLYSLAADQGSGLGLYGQGMCTKFGYGVRKDDAAGDELLRQSVEKMAAEAQEETDPYTRGRMNYYAGRCYFHGIGVDTNYSLAEEFFLKAAEDENPTALQYLGQLAYRRGNTSEALEYFAASGDKGDDVGAVNAGRFYLLGIGTDENPELAVKYLQLALDLGQTDVKSDLRKAEKALEQAKKDAEAQAQEDGGEEKG